MTVLYKELEKMSKEEIEKALKAGARIEIVDPKHEPSLETDTAGRRGGISLRSTQYSHINCGGRKEDHGGIFFTET